MKISRSSHPNLSHLFVSFLTFLSKFAMLVTLLSFFGIFGYIFYQGIPELHLDVFSWNYNSENASMMPAIINTFLMIVFSIFIATPIGVGCGIYLNEYAKNQKFITTIDLVTTTLAGIPSVVFGLFGYLIFVLFFNFNYSFLSGVLTLSIIILPVIIKTTEESLKCVPNSYREGSLALGVQKSHTIFKILIPSAINGISSGIFLSIGRIISESAALIYTSGTLAKVFDGFLSSGRSLSVHLYALLSEGFYFSQAYATACMLLIVILVINSISTILFKIFTKEYNG